MRRIFQNVTKRIYIQGDKKMNHQKKINKLKKLKDTQENIKIRKEVKVNFKGKIVKSKKRIITMSKRMKSINPDNKGTPLTQITLNILRQVQKLTNPKRSSKFIRHCQINTRKKLSYSKETPQFPIEDQMNQI